MKNKRHPNLLHALLQYVTWKEWIALLGTLFLIRIITMLRYQELDAIYPYLLGGAPATHLGLFDLLLWSGLHFLPLFFLIRRWNDEARTLGSFLVIRYSSRKRILLTHLRFGLQIFAIYWCGIILSPFLLAALFHIQLISLYSLSEILLAWMLHVLSAMSLLSLFLFTRVIWHSSSRGLVVTFALIAFYYLGGGLFPSVFVPVLQTSILSLTDFLLFPAFRGIRIGGCLIQMSVLILGSYQMIKKGANHENEY